MCAWKDVQRNSCFSGNIESPGFPSCTEGLQGRPVLLPSLNGFVRKLELLGDILVHIHQVRVYIDTCVWKSLSQDSCKGPCMYEIGQVSAAECWCAHLRLVKVNVGDDHEHDVRSLHLYTVPREQHKSKGGAFSTLALTLQEICQLSTHPFRRGVIVGFCRSTTYTHRGCTHL